LISPFFATDKTIKNKKYLRHVSQQTLMHFAFNINSKWVNIFFDVNAPLFATQKEVLKVLKQHFFFSPLPLHKIISFNIMIMNSEKVRNPRCRCRPQMQYSLIFHIISLLNFLSISMFWLYNGVFDCNQNWLIFMRFHACCCSYIFYSMLLCVFIFFWLILLQILVFFFSIEFIAFHSFKALEKLSQLEIISITHKVIWSSLATHLCYWD
jgi:hypothetical protein